MNVSVAKRVKVGFDVDGVLANWATPFSQIGNKLYGRPVVTEDNMDDWDWSKWWGTQDEVDGTWSDLIHNHPGFWLNEIRPLPIIWPDQDFFNDMELYAITARVETALGTSVQNQTARWLQRHFAGQWCVIPAYEKIPVIKALKLDYFIDDKGSTIERLYETKLDNRGFYLLNRKHNVGTGKVRRVNTVEEYLCLIREEVVYGSQ